MGVTVDTKVQVAQKSVTIAILDVTADMHAMQTVKAVTKRQVCVSLAVNLDGKAVCVIQRVTVECTGKVVTSLVDTAWSQNNVII